ncbi:MAG TPA: pyridoxal-phosphate dependent enzyme [Kofleriaceae bacterium]|nr:pyridoxal-phosphate dependent enzyme [Kofleriaceae bacterium]
MSADGGRRAPGEPIPIDRIRAARDRIAGLALRTPLVRLHLGDGPEVYLKLENLQPIGSFKLRGAGNAMACLPDAELARGVYTASAGNMAQGVAWVARARGVACTVVVPDHAPRAKLEAIDRLGGRIIKVPFDRWWQIIVEHRFEGVEGAFIHPVCDPEVIAGNGTIGLEILEDLPDVDAVLVPYGGGGLVSGIASALRALAPRVRVLASEVETAAPLAPSLAAGELREVGYTPTFVDGCGSRSVLPEMWPLVRGLVGGSVVVPIAEVAAAVRLLVERARVVAEGAGAVSVAAALSGRAGGGKLCCVVSGGNLDSDKLAAILGGRLP